MHSGDFDVEVTWGEKKFSVHMTATTSPPSRPFWGGQLGAIRVHQTLTVKGEPMVLASVDIPDVLDPGDGRHHSLDGYWEVDVPSAVATLYGRLQLVREWADGLIERQEVK